MILIDIICREEKAKMNKILKKIFQCKRNEKSDGPQNTVIWSAAGDRLGFSCLNIDSNKHQ
jgi:hypothetical protein